MGNVNSNSGYAVLSVLERGKVKVYPLSTRSSWSVGRQSPDATPNISLLSGLASRNHATILQEGGCWYYIENPNNTNGTYYNGQKVPKSQSGKNYRVALRNGDVLKIQIGTPNTEPVVMHFSTVGSGSTFGAVALGNGQNLIGRSSSCKICIPQPYVSSSHARIDCGGGKAYLSDCGSKSGTFVNGMRISGMVQLNLYDCISICGKPIYYLGSQVLVEGNAGGAAAAVYSGNKNVILRADIETKRVKNNAGSGTKELIRSIHLEIREGTLVALLGTAGAGKSTVMNCLNGMDLEGVQGRVLYRNVDLMRNFSQMKHMIGSVPQKKTFHPSFTPEQEFTFAAQKRLPGNVSDQQIQQRVNQTLDMLSMNGVRNVPNSKLSGGEQTRVNVGIELVADRDLLCLDEPDQGLSPNYKHELFQILRNLAHKNGKSILTIIHDVSEIDMFDQVIMLAKVDGVGRLAFSGTPADARKYFGTDIQNAYALLEKNPQKYVR